MEKRILIVLLVSIMVLSLGFGALGGFYAGYLLQSKNPLNGIMATDSGNGTTIVRVNEESAVIKAVENVNPAVVSIIVTKDLPVIERYYESPFGSGDMFERFFGDGMGDFFGFGIPRYRENGTEERQVGGGSGFMVSADGYIITNKHVVLDEQAEYTVLMNDETKHKAEVLARDPLNDIAILKIEGKDLPFVELGESSNLKVGQSVIAIGNSLGEFSNTVSTGVISGLSRSITAGSYGQPAEQLLGVIQTDASINPGNSGGPLLNIAGQVIGMNTAIAQGAENIGFAIPVNEIKNIYNSVREKGRIVRPWLGVRYVQLNEALAKENNLDVDYGALIVRGEERMDLAVIPGSPADKADLRENDIILELNGERIDSDNPLARAIARFQPGDEVTLKVWSRGEEKEVEATLDEMQ